MENIVKKKIGFAICGSFCTHQAILKEIQSLVSHFDIFPILSEISASTDTRFGKASEFQNSLIEITGNRIIHTIPQAEPIGPKNLFDLIVIAPCTGNTLGKLSLGITDSCVTMASKAHLRNNKPLLIAISTNDAIGASAKNIGHLLNYKNIFFVPMRQDDPVNKPNSIVADFSKLKLSIDSSLSGKQLQPLYI